MATRDKAENLEGAKPVIVDDDHRAFRFSTKVTYAAGTKNFESKQGEVGIKQDGRAKRAHVWESS